MNDRIRELAREAGIKMAHDETLALGYLDTAHKKFSELIIRECAAYCEGHILPKGMAEENDLNYNDGVMDCTVGLKQHFGVKE